MKSYFAKWLPVEGEVKTGDNYIDTLAKIPGKVWRLYPEGIDFPLEQMRKVQLFLCSRDIKAGDKVWDWLNERFEEVDTSFIAEETSDGKNVPCWYLKTQPKTFHETQFLIKVIGPISLEATWVKEDDEFEEKEVEAWWWTDKYEYFQRQVYRSEKHDKKKENLFLKLKKVFKIKCPCCGEFK